MTCTFIFKCRKCGEEHEGPVGGEKSAMFGLMSAVFNLPYPDTLIGLPPKMHDIHTCENGEFVGVSDLIGYRIDK
ncbi:hypothetical protein LCGC14_1097900 [marine sediment metagenome]|uniref:Uncharacterized protein n=1 Tax=marine sediment metagenome TaxID=412755 RepID=A0A0F9MYA2_9ZZZZ